MQRCGTKWLVGKKDQVKFYAPATLVREFDRVLTSQKISLTDAMTTLMEVAMVDAERLTPLLFNQVRGDTAKLIARYILRVGPIGPHLSIIATESSVAEFDPPAAPPSPSPDTSGKRRRAAGQIPSRRRAKGSA